MEDKIRLKLFRIIYDELNLKEIEDIFLDNNIPKKEIDNPTNEEVISHYFFLRNDINLGRLSSEENEKLKELIDSNSDDSNKELKSFLKNNMFKLLLPETNQKYLFWDSNDLGHLAPADAIVIAFHTLRYVDLDQDIIDKNRMLINEKLNYIQNVSEELTGYKVAVLEYDETPNFSELDAFNFNKFL